MASPLLPFTGGLRPQAPYIVKALTHYVTKQGLDKRFCDPFFGGGSISYEAARLGYEVHSSDISLRSIVPAKCLIEHRVERGAERVHGLCAPAPDWESFLDFDRVLGVIEHEPLKLARQLWLNATTPTEKYIGLRCLLGLVPSGGFGLMKKTETSDGAIAGWARSATKCQDIVSVVERMRGVVNGGVSGISTSPAGTASQQDAREFLAKCGSEGVSVAHLDPPTYGTKGYTNLYWWLDAIIEDPVDPSISGFTKDTAVSFVEDCVDAAKEIPVVAITQQNVSYPLQDAIGVLTDAGREVSSYEVPIATTANPFYIAIGLAK